MSNANANDVHKGQAIKFNGAVCVILETQHRTPGNLRAFVQLTIRNLKTGKSSVERFGSSDKLEIVPITRTKYEFSYKDGEDYVFIEPNTFDNLTLSPDKVAKIKDYLTENQAVEVLFTDEVVAEVELPSTVTLKIAESADGVRGDSANNVMKIAILETGLQVQVPLFIKEGELVKISTEDGKYLSRA
ncbi:elongation factor P [Verrucomicrobium sp. GAS474]|uniref:elongation factor P n=1 Tax=Verrucomicrobium sp. GAS474 TaxID=1882831 RepID=UPI00087D42B1|nr:elongation factor P [Verrucomicrobium sp. GAS474]SDU01735.1 elongation factor P [Verrucomicrobium sp. GAS474]